MTAQKLILIMLAYIAIASGPAMARKAQKTADDDLPCGVTWMNFDTNPPTETPGKPCPPKPKSDKPWFFDINTIANKTKPEVEEVLGKPKSCEKSKYGLKCYFAKNETDIMFIDEVADWITIHDMGDTLYGVQALSALGLPAKLPVFANHAVMRWNSIEGFEEININPSGKNIFYALIYTNSRPH